MENLDASEAAFGGNVGLIDAALDLRRRRRTKRDHPANQSRTRNLPSKSESCLGCRVAGLIRLKFSAMSPALPIVTASARRNRNANKTRIKEHGSQQDSEDPRPNPTPH
jgi:hypothetical protein